MAMDDLIVIRGYTFPRHPRAYTGPLRKAERYRQLRECIEIAMSLCSAEDKSLHMMLVKSVASARSSHDEARSALESLNGSLFSPTTLPPP